jgi:4'-phosphopantetheinyl transferase
VTAALALVTETEVPAGDGWLSAAERETLASLRVPARRLDWRLGRWAARRAVAAVLGTAAVEVRAAADGAPEVLAGGLPVPVTVSISHRAGLAACLAMGGRRPVGCDLELVEPHSPALARDFFTPAELALVERARPDGRDLTVALVWSAKESALKALRQGLRLDTREVEVRLDCAAGPGWRPLQAHHGARTFAGWWRLEDRHVLTVVTDPPVAPPALLRSSHHRRA